MKCVAVSDIHMKDVVTPEADLLIVSGDMTFYGRQAEMDWYAGWLKRQPQKYKIWIAGNHELGVEENPNRAIQIAKLTQTIYLDDSGVEIEGLKIWGSPVTPFFRSWAFNRHRGKDIREHWNLVPIGLDLLITHGPPYGYLDETAEGDNVGCEDLLALLKEELPEPPQVVIFGHIHEGYGSAEIVREDGYTIKLFNASSCNKLYQAVNEPFVFELTARSHLQSSTKKP